MSNYRTPRDLSGQQFGRLTVLSQSEPWRKGRPSQWLCRCECGTELPVARDSLTGGNTRSCGCLHRDQLIARLTTHGRSGTSEYEIWQKMVARCNDPRCKEYKFYGQKSVKVCPRWAGSFEQFFSDMGPRPSRRHSLDRFPDNKGDYGPGNVRWATYAEQARNTSRNKWLTHNGRTMIVQDWANELGCDPSVLFARIKRGLSTDQVLVAPARNNHSKAILEFGGESLSCSEWATRTGIDRRVIVDRIKSGWSPEKALTTPVRPKSKPKCPSARPPSRA